MVEYLICSKKSAHKKMVESGRNFFNNNIVRVGTAKFIAGPLNFFPYKI